VLVMPDADLNDWTQARQFASVINDLPADSSGAPTAAISDSQMLIDIFDRMESELRWMLPLVFAAMIAVGAAAFGLRRAFWWLIGMLVVGGAAVTGTISLLGLPFNFMSALVLPVLVGLAVDSAFHTLMQIERPHLDLRAYLGTQLAIAASYGTTMIGLGALILSTHSGLQSMGIIAVAGLSVLLVFHLTVAVFLVARRMHVESLSDGRSQAL
jgi:predicted RND superfamily exporter protein